MLQHLTTKFPNMFDPLNTFANINIGDQIMSKVVTCKTFQKCANMFDKYQYWCTRATFCDQIRYWLKLFAAPAARHPQPHIAPKYWQIDTSWPLGHKTICPIKMDGIFKNISYYLNHLICLKSNVVLCRLKLQKVC